VNLLGATLAGLLDRPATGSMVAAIVAALVGFGFLRWAEWSTRPARPDPGPDSRPPDLTAGPERPAVIGLLTSGYEVPDAAVHATVLDLAHRGWVRLAHSDGELVLVTKAAAAPGDSLRPYEQLVLNHLASRAFGGVTSATVLASSQRRLDRSWWQRFRASVAEYADSLGLTRPRYPVYLVAPAAACAAVAAFAALTSIRNGREVAVVDSWQSRTVWFATVAAIVLLAWRTIGRARSTARLPTAAGAERAGLWLGYRARLAARIPPQASVVGAPQQQEALGRAYAMGLCAQVGAELPIAPEDPRRAWSSAGGVPHVVRVRYPVLPGYGQHPLKVLIGGLVVLLAALWLRRYLGDVADGEALGGLLDKAPGQLDLFHGIARTLSVLCLVPAVAAGWCVFAGTVDTLFTRQRTGVVVRTRRPYEVLPRGVVSIIQPLGERGGFLTYLAVDDGRRTTLGAWLANEHSAAPQGAQARVRATPLLGYVRSSEPVGTALSQ